MDDRIQSGGEYSRVGREDAVGELPRPPAQFPFGWDLALASIALGSVFALMAFPAMLMIFTIADVQFRGWPRVAVGAAAVVGLLGGLFVLASAALGLVFGIMGISAARSVGRPIAPGLAGVLLGILDLWMWLGIFIVWIAAIADNM